METSTTRPTGASEPQERTAGSPPRLITRFGEMVDVRNRGAVRINRFAGSTTASHEAPAIVRLWHAEQCKEMSAHEARAFAAQLLAAAALADSQNSH